MSHSKLIAQNMVLFYYVLSTQKKLELRFILSYRYKFYNYFDSSVVNYLEIETVVSDSLIVRHLIPILARKLHPALALTLKSNQ